VSPERPVLANETSARFCGYVVDQVATILWTNERKLADTRGGNAKRMKPIPFPRMHLIQRLCFREQRHVSTALCYLVTPSSGISSRMEATDLTRIRHWDLIHIYRS
jgi:hypothetical protein